MQNHPRDQRSHDTMRNELQAYAHRRVLAEPPDGSDLEIAAHLMECADCRADFDVIMEGPALPARGQLAASQAWAAMSDSPRSWQPQVAASPWHTGDDGALWLVCPPLLRPAPQLGAARGEAISRYEWGESDDEPALTIELLLERNPATVLLCLTLDVPSRNALDQSGVSVTLYNGASERQATTDASGTVRFPNVPIESLGNLRFQVLVGRTV
jgi:hypothetical protein